jgi:hypothetical protein
MAAPALVRDGGGDEATGRSLSHFGVPLISAEKQRSPKRLSSLRRCMADP